MWRVCVKAVGAVAVVAVAATGLAGERAFAQGQACDQRDAPLDSRTVLQMPRAADPERPLVVKGSVPGQPERASCGHWQRSDARLFVKLPDGGDVRLDKVIARQRRIGAAELGPQAEPLDVAVYVDVRGRQPSGDPPEMIARARDNSSVIPVNQLRFVPLSGGLQLSEPHAELVSVDGGRFHRFLIVVCQSVCSRGEIDEVKELEAKQLLRQIAEDRRSPQPDRRDGQQGGGVVERRDPQAGGQQPDPSVPRGPQTPAERRAEAQQKQREAAEARVREEAERRQAAQQGGRGGQPPDRRDGQGSVVIAGPGPVVAGGPAASAPATPSPAPTGRITLRFFNPETGDPVDNVITRLVRGGCGNRDSVQSVLVKATGSTVNVYGDPREPICVIVRGAANDEHCIRLPRAYPLSTDPARPSDVGLQLLPRAMPGCPAADPWKVRLVTVGGTRLDPELAADLIGERARLSGVPLRLVEGDFEARLGQEQIERLRGAAGLKEIELPTGVFALHGLSIDQSAQMVRVAVVPRVVGLAAFKFELWTGDGTSRVPNPRCELQLEVAQAHRAGAAWLTVGQQRLLLVHESGARYALRLSQDPDGRLLRRLHVTMPAVVEAPQPIKIVSANDRQAGCSITGDALTADDFETQLVVRSTR